MKEPELLFQVLNSDVKAAEAKHWLDDAFGVHELGDDLKNKHLNFKSYDPLSFVVTILNFLREDTAPLLAPSVERSQTIDNASPGSPLVNESLAGERKIVGVRVTNNVLITITYTIFLHVRCADWAPALALHVYLANCTIHIRRPVKCVFDIL